MLEVLYITFEKITGLQGTISGYFIGDARKIDPKLPIIFEVMSTQESESGELFFTQLDNWITLKPAVPNEWSDYKRHFELGVNFLIKDIKNGRGEGIKFTGSPN